MSRKYEYLTSIVWPFIYTYPKFKSIDEIDIKRIKTRINLEDPKPGKDK